MKVLAIDPGINFAYAVSNNRKLIARGLVKTPIDQKLNIRLGIIRVGIKDLLREYLPDIVLLEEQNTGFDRKSHGRVVNRQSLQIYSAAWATINAVISEWGIPCFYIPAGRGKLPKKLAQKIACDITGKKRINHNIAEAINWACNYKEAWIKREAR